MNATASPAAITLNQTSNITFKFSSYRNGTGVKEYDGPVYVYLKLNSTLGSIDRPVASTDEEIFYTPSESGNGSVTGTFKNAYYTINIENSKIPTEITLLNDTLDVKVLEFIPDVATIDPAEAGNLSYSSSNSSVAVIFKDRIIPVGTGQANITVSFAGNDIYAATENKTIPINVELNDARVSVDNDTLELFVEDTYAINATTVPDILKKYYLINYTSSDDSVATVDKNGTVTAVGEGTAIITVEVGDNRIFAKNSTTVTVTVSKIPTEITVANTTLDMAPLDDFAINATLDPAEAGYLTYNSTNSSVAGVLFGNVVAVGEGKATITVSFNGTAKYAASEKIIEVTVTKLPTEISVNETSIEMNPFDTAAINATLTPAEAGSLSYASSNSSVAIVFLGQIIAVGEGEATITVSFNGTARYAASERIIEVTVTKLPTEISVNETAIEMVPLDIASINATLTPANAGFLSYASSNSSVATVILGQIVAVGEGEATITVSFNGTMRYAAAESKTIEVTVKKIPTEITIENTTIEMVPLDITPVGANLTNNASNIFLNYVSSNSSVAIVFLGQIIAVGEGEATITVSFNGTARYAAAENKTIEVTVKKIPTEITIESDTIEMAPLDITPSGANLTNNASNIFLNYVSSDSSVAIVVLGEIIAVGEGKATITVSFNGTARYAVAENRTIDVIVTKIPTEIIVEEDTIEMNPLDIVPSGARLSPGLDLELTYTSSNTSVVRVILGEIVAVGEGEATITVSFNGDVRYEAAESKTIDVTVTKIPTEITVENDTIEMAPLDAVPTGVSLTPAEAGFVSYVSSNSSVATVFLGQIIAVGEGTATITVSYNGTVRYTAAESKTIEVTVKKIPTEITIENTTIDLKVLDVVPSGANLTPGLDLILNYESSNSSVATVVLGEIIAVGEGTATITVYFNGNMRYAAAENKTITVTVSLRDASVSVENDTLDLTVDDTYTINATTDPVILKYLALNFTSSDESVATVDENGTVTAVGQGTAIITVTVGKGIVYAINSTDVTVIVSRIPYEPDVTLDEKTLTVEVPENATGDITLLIGDETIVAPIEDGVATFDLSDVPAGDYNASIMYEGDRLYDGFEMEYPISVLADFIITAEDVTKYYGGSERFAVTLKDLNGKPIDNANIKITINGQTYTKTTDNNGETSIALNLNSGVYNVTTEYNGTKVYSTVTVKDTVIAKDVTKIFRNGTQYQGTFVDSEGNLIKNTDIRININGVFYTRTTDANGMAQMNINLPPGTYILTAINPSSSEQHTTIVTVLLNIVENYDVTKYYKNASQYSLRLLDDKGNPVGAGVSIQLNINGVFYTRTSDANGYVKMNINLPPGTYIITAEYKGLRMSNTIKVLTVLEAKDLVMKYHDGSQFKVKVLDGQGRPYAGQTVTYNINGVFYTKTTDGDGIAALTINLPAGEYIITSMYNGLNSANKVTISG